MKFAVRALVLGMFAAGCSAAVLSSHAKATFVPNHQAVSSAYPMPTCGPNHCTTGK
jgi:hypothetical protein